jgi:hypothetical protein
MLDFEICKSAVSWIGLDCALYRRRQHGPNNWNGRVFQFERR